MRADLALIFGVAATIGSMGCGVGPKGDGGNGDEDSTVAGPTTAPSESTGEGTTTTGSASGTTTTESSDDGPSADGAKFDAGFLPDTPEAECGGNDGGGGGSGVELTYIWIANSSQQTVSKIDTDSMVEEGRYRAKQANGDPSRTSVNLQGDVAVANRNGGVAKFWANPDHCVESNGQAGIQTSSGGNDILAWEEEECRAWYTDFICNSNRPVAWTRGEWNAATCSYSDIKLWTVCNNDVHLLDGETGIVETTVQVPGGNAFVYGGAADAFGNFWGLNTNSGQLFRVDHEDHSTVSFPLPNGISYGITVDPEGRPWVCGGGSAGRFDLDTSTWQTTGAGGGIGGCMTDGVSTLWHDNGNGTLLGFDLETLAVVNMIPLPEYVHGVSVDFQGKVWGVSFAGSNAYRADPITLQVDTFTGLVGAYTYSDMTGFALNTAGGGDPPN